MLKGLVASFDGWQRRHTLAGFPVGVLKKFGEDRASSLAALSAYYAFFSLFPLLLAFVSILGFVLDDDTSLRDDVVDTALDRIPVIGEQLAAGVHPITGSGTALVVGIVGAVWAAHAVAASDRGARCFSERFRSARRSRATARKRHGAIWWPG